MHTIKHCIGIKYLVLHSTQFYFLKFTVKRTQSFSFFPQAPCPPSQVQATIDCAGKRVLVSWLSSRFSGFYMARMADQSGGLLNCTTMNNSCWVSGLKCGQVYNITVTYNNGLFNCPNKISVPIRINSGKSGKSRHVYWVSGFLTKTLHGVAGCKWKKDCGNIMLASTFWYYQKHCRFWCMLGKRFTTFNCIWLIIWHNNLLHNN